MNRTAIRIADGPGSSPGHEAVRAHRFASGRVGKVAFAALLTAASGCTDMPVVSPQALGTHQQALSSVSHWQQIAKLSATDILPEPTRQCPASQVTVLCPSGEKPIPAIAPCVVIAKADDDHKTQFQSFLEDALPTELLRRNHSQLKVFSSANYDEFYLACEWISIDSIVVKHEHSAANRYPGKYTILATGLVVVRNVAKAFSEVAGVGLVAAGEATWWASSGIRGPSYTAEVAVTISSTTFTGEFKHSITNVYYIDASESHLYEYETPKHAENAGQSDTFPELSTHALPSLPPLPEKPPEESPVEQLEVLPHEGISKCDTSAVLTVIGTRLTQDASNYHLGPLPATSVRWPPSNAPPATPYGSIRQSTQVRFEQLQSQNKGLSSLPLVVNEAYGPATASIPVAGECTQSSPATTAPHKAGTPVTASLSGTWILNLKKSTFAPGPPPKSESRTYQTSLAGDNSMSSTGTSGDGQLIGMIYRGKEDGQD